MKVYNAKFTIGIFLATYLEFSTKENLRGNSVTLHLFNNSVRTVLLSFMFRLLFNFCLAGLSRIEILRYTLFSLVEELYKVRSSS
jgi:hypothetical protein